MQLRGSLPLLFLGSSLALLAALAPAMWHMWIHLASANSNFYYAVTLLFGAWQVRSHRHMVVGSQGMCKGMRACFSGALSDVAAARRAAPQRSGLDA